MKNTRFVFAVCSLLLIMTLAASCSSLMIEDTNGDEDSSLATLTDEDILNGYSSISVNSFKTTSNGVTKLSVKQFSGVQTVGMIKSGGGTAFKASVELNSGNLEVVLVKDGEITHRIPVNEETEIILDQNSAYELKIAGESADFSIEYKNTEESI